MTHLSSVNLQVEETSSFGKILLLSPVKTHVLDMLAPLAELSDRLTIIRSLSALQDELDHAAPLPVCVILPWSVANPPELTEMAAYLKGYRRNQHVEVPLVIITSGNAQVPLNMKASACFSDAIPPSVLIPRLAMVRRMALRSEEARLRRRLLGTQIASETFSDIDDKPTLLLAGMGGHFALVQSLTDRKAEVIATFTADMTLEFLGQRTFEALMLDGPLWESCDTISRLRADPRFYSLPTLAYASNREDAETLYAAGATDVLVGNMADPAVYGHLMSALRAGRRQRLSNGILTASSKLLSRGQSNGLLDEQIYLDYLEMLKDSTGRRGESVFELDLLDLIGRFTAHDDSLMSRNRDAWTGTVLSIAMAVCRDEDFVANVENRGPIALLRTKKGMDQLSSRIMMMVRTTGLGT
ncbi:DNA-binding response regulator [Pseudovibrio sp. SPO723]|uniref:DNA-binding response regulator n=1 Tax=Nesiotobacter zosterae TaxID=392721 RepID=UPI0029C1F0FA|nr:DNA-binding response regulator [Pseudovibrio sp. SPO723]MDX5592858.1 DNA-binding response regulator [Pseudovibrio sp. SPO723]